MENVVMRLREHASCRAAARAFALCRVGAVTFELAVCAERLEVRGLLRSLVAGDTTYLRP